MHGDLDGSGAFDGDGGEREVADGKYLPPAVGGGACGEEVTGREGNTSPGLDGGQVRDLLIRAGRITA